MLSERSCKNPPGFTLIELSVVIAIITILATITIPNVRLYLRKARDSKRASDIQVLALAFESFYDDQGHYPGWEDDNRIGSNGECIGIFGRTAPPAGSECQRCGPVDGALDALLRRYIHGPIPHDPLYDNNPTEFYYGYDPYHWYWMPLAVDWSTDPATCPAAGSSLAYPNSGLPAPLTNQTAILTVHQFETDTVERHRDTCNGGDIGIDTADYNIAFPEVGFGNTDATP